MNSKEKAKSVASKSYEKKPPRVLSLMMPRNLIPSTPIRFNSTESSLPNTSHSNSVIRESQKIKKGKSNSPLALGYVDRSAQRRSEAVVGIVSFECETLNEKSYDQQVQQEKQENDALDARLKFLEFTDLKKFPECLNESTERIMKFLLDSNAKTTTKTGAENFRANEAFLQFKSIEETKNQPFDPFSLPKKVFRASAKNSIENCLFNYEEEIFKRVKEAMERLKTSAERNKKYLQVLQKESGTDFDVNCENKDSTDKYNVNDINNESGSNNDIFPDAGRFDERSELELSIKSETKPIVLSKAKSKDRLFNSIKLQKSTVKQEKKQVEEIDIFEMIAQKPLNENNLQNDILFDKSSNGGLFGFSNVLPKLSRLEVVESLSSGNGSANLTGAYASILSDNDDQREGNEEPIKTLQEPNDEDSSLYPGHLENDHITYDSEDEDFNDKNTKFISEKNKKRKLTMREDKEASKIEKLVKSKFGVDLLK